MNFIKKFNKLSLDIKNYINIISNQKNLEIEKLVYLME